MKNNKYICLRIFEFQMISQKNSLDMRMMEVMKILDKCKIIVKFQKILTKAYLMNGMKKFQILAKNLAIILQRNMIFKEQD